MYIEIPEWAQEGHISVVLNHFELVAYKEAGKNSPIIQKVVRCNHCGECCLSVGPDGPFGSDDEGKCTKLVRNGKVWLCKAGELFPSACVPDVDKKVYTGCCIEHKEQTVAK